MVKKLLKRASNNKASLDREIIGKIINNPNTPLFLIEELFEFNYNDESIYEALASNYNITSSLLEKLAQKLLDRFTKNCHSQLDALIAVVNNPKISSNLRKTIVDKLESINNEYYLDNSNNTKILYLSYLSSQFLDKLIQEADSINNIDALEKLAHHPNLTPNALKKLLEHKNKNIRLHAIAINPNTPFTILQRLENDGNRIVRAAAKAKLANIEFTG